MPAPTSALTSTRPDLAGAYMEFGLEMAERGYIASRVFPVMEVLAKAGTFFKVSVEEILKTVDTARAPGSRYKRQSWKFAPVSFATEDHGEEEPVDASEAAMYATAFDLELMAAKRALDVVLRSYEARVAALVFNATTYTGAALTTAVGTEWSTLATATPIDNIIAAKQKIRDNSGLEADTLVVNTQVFDNLINCAQIVERIKYAGIQDPNWGAIAPAAAAQALNLRQVLVAGKVKNTAKEGQNAVLAQIWSSEYVMLCKVSASPDLREPCIGRTLHWGEDGSQVGGLVESYEEPQSRSTVVRCRHDVDEVLMHIEAGHLLSNITA